MALEVDIFVGSTHLTPATETVTDVLAHELVATPGAGKRIRVYGYYVSSDAAMLIKLRSGATDSLLELYLGANGGLMNPPGKTQLFSCSENESLDVIGSVASNFFVRVDYVIVPS